MTQIQTSIENTLLDLLCGAEAVVRVGHLGTDRKRRVAAFRIAQAASGRGLGDRGRHAKRSAICCATEL